MRHDASHALVSWLGLCPWPRLFLEVMFRLEVVLSGLQSLEGPVAFLMTGLLAHMRHILQTAPPDTSSWQAFTLVVGAPDWSPDVLKVHPISPHEDMAKSDDSDNPSRGVPRLPAFP